MAAFEKRLKKNQRRRERLDNMVNKVQERYTKSVIQFKNVSNKIRYRFLSISDSWTLLEEELTPVEHRESFYLLPRR
jgi:esterase/lipase